MLKQKYHNFFLCEIFGKLNLFPNGFDILLFLCLFVVGIEKCLLRLREILIKTQENSFKINLQKYCEK